MIEAEQVFEISTRHWAAVGPAREVRKDLAGALRLGGCVAWAAGKNAAPAGRIPRTCGIEGPGDLHAVDTRDAVHVLQIVIPGERLQRLVGGRGVAADKRHDDGPRSGLDRDTCPQARINRIFGDAQVGVRHFVVFLAAYLSQKYAMAVDTDFTLVRILEARKVTDDVLQAQRGDALQQQNAEVVFAVQGKVVVDLDAASRTQR